MTSLRDVAASCRDTILYFLNWKAGLISVVVNGPVVTYANWEHGLFISIGAGLVQAVVSFMLTAFTAGVAQRISDNIINPLPAYTFGTFVPGGITFALSFGAHVWNETPELLESALWPTFLSCSTSITMNVLIRNYASLPQSLQLAVRIIVMKSHRIPS